ncbi:MAG TPA: MFS transporter [Anaerolineae bacterium]|nr:MFS transporter [Anaerolineae bacterium]
MALSLTGDSTMYAVLASQIDVVGIGLGVVGLLLGANRMIRIPGNLMAGALYDRSRRRPLFLLGLSLGIVSTLSYSLVRGFWPLLLGRVLWGIAWSLINVGGYTMILDRSTAVDRGRMTGLYQMAFMLGLTISPILGGALTDTLGFRSAVRICALVSSIGLVVTLAALPETRPRWVEGSHPAWGKLDGQRLLHWANRLRRIDRRMLAASYIYFATLFVSSGVLMSTLGLYLERRWGSDIAVGSTVIGVASLAGVMLGMRALLGIVAGPVAGALSDRLGDRWPVVRGGILLGAGGFLTLAFLGGVGAVPTGVAAVSLGAGALAATLAAIAGDMAQGGRRGVTMGGLATAGDIGSALGPPLAYALAVTLDLRWVYLFCTLVLASGLMAAAGQGRRRIKI